MRSAGIPAVDGIVLDVGVSSMQLDQAERGFSFRNDGPLDMRMGADGPSAADVVAAASERDLSHIIATLGEERFARARRPRHRRSSASKRRSRPRSDLADIVGRVVRSKPGEIHPATRTFQALRIFVNEELHELADGLAAAERVLAPGGRLAVISFHSLEDRIVKRFLDEPQPPRRGLASSAGGAKRRAVVSRCSRPRRSSPMRRRPPKIRAPAPPSCAPPSAPMRRRSPRPLDALPPLPSLADIMKGR